MVAVPSCVLLTELRHQLPDLEPPAVPRGGLHLWLSLPSDLDDVEVADRARSQQVVVGPGRPYFVSEPPGPRLRLSYAAADPAQLTAGVQVLRDVVYGPGEP